MKKIVVILVVFFVLLFSSFFCFSTYKATVFAEGSVKEELTENIESQLEKLSFADFEEFIASLSEEELLLFENSGFLDKIKSVLNGDFATEQTSFFGAILNLIGGEIVSILPIISLVVAIAITFSLVSSARPQGKNKSLQSVIHFVCFASIIILLLTCVSKTISISTNAISSITKQMNLVFPIMLTVLTAVGGVTSVSVYQPAVAILTSSIATIFSAVLMPLFIFKLVFSIVSNLNGNIKLEKFADFCSSLFKWIIGIMFTVFGAFIAISGIGAGGVDSISFKTAKYAIKNSVPLIGGYISDSFNIILASSVLIKNAVGVAGLFLLLSTIIVPILQLVVFMFALKFASAVLEPIADSKISNFMTMLAKSISLLIILIVGVAFMYLLMVGLLIGTCNNF